VRLQYKTSSCELLSPSSLESITCNTISAQHSIMSAEASFAKRISPQSAAGEEASTKNAALRDLTNANQASNEEDKIGQKLLVNKTVGAPAAETKMGGVKYSEQDLLAEVCSTWSAGKHTRQSVEAKVAVRKCLQRGIAPKTISNAVVRELSRQNLSSEGEAERVKEFSYNTNKALKKEQDRAAACTEKVAKTVFSTDQGKTSRSDLEDLMSVGIPFQRNGVVYLHADTLNKRKAKSSLDAVSEQSSANDAKKQLSERHWMEMWLNAKTELTKLREELKGETDEEVKDELKSDIDCLKKKKDEWAMLLGMK
jgi:hypothetical protein